MTAHIGAWWIRHERSRDPAWRRRVERALADLLAHPDGLAHGGQRPFDPASGGLGDGGRPFPSGLAHAFGGPQTLIELAGLLDHHALAEALLRLARSHGISADQHAALPPERREQVQTRWVLTGLMAWAAERSGDADLARRAWDILVREGAAHATARPAGHTIAAMVTVPQPSPWRGEPVTGTTLRLQTVAQWSLNLIACLRYAPDAALDPRADQVDPG